MNQRTTTPTLTFLRYADFVAELVRREVEAVRLERGTRNKPIANAPDAYLDYVVVLTALDDERNGSGTPEVLVCTLQVGGCWEMFKSRHPEYSANLRAAAELVKTNLEQWGLSVRPGVYAHDNNWGYASPDGLWHFQEEDGKAILVAGPGEGDVDVGAVCAERNESLRRAVAGSEREEVAR
jgi:hypothetical protein